MKNKNAELLQALECVVGRLTADCGDGDYSNLCRQKLIIDAREIAEEAIKKAKA